MDCLYNEKPAVIANSGWSKIGFNKCVFSVLNLNNFLLFETISFNADVEPNALH